MTTSSSRAEDDLIVEYVEDPRFKGLFNVTVAHRSGEERTDLMRYVGAVRSYAVGLVVEQIRAHRPSRVFVSVGDKMHKISTSMVTGIIEGRVTPIDITVG